MKLHFHDFVKIGEVWRKTGNPKFESAWTIEECVRCPKRREHETHAIRRTKTKRPVKQEDGGIEAGYFD